MLGKDIGTLKLELEINEKEVDCYKRTNNKITPIGAQDRGEGTTYHANKSRCS